MHPKRTCYSLRIALSSILTVWSRTGTKSAFAVDYATPNHGALYSVQYVKLIPMNWPSGDNSPVNSAARMWNSTCMGSTGNAIPQFWTASTNPPASYSLLNVVWNSGLAPVLDRCGDFSGTTINIYQFTRKSSNNEVVSCTASNGYDELVAHELGHRLGLDEAPSNLACRNVIMSAINGYAHAVTQEECAETDGMNITPGEANDGCINPSDCRQSPILIKLDRGPWTLTDFKSGVLFDFDGDGVPVRTAWTSAGSQIGFLFLDKNGNGCADSGVELFGDSMVVEGFGIAANGFEALVSFDANRDRWITPGDRSWTQLRIWTDTDHDGICRLGEVQDLSQTTLLALSLDYRSHGKLDPNDNEFRLVANGLMRGDLGQTVRLKVYDVFFVTSTP